jgi:hypothetical protein
MIKQMVTFIFSRASKTKVYCAKLCGQNARSFAANYNNSCHWCLRNRDKRGAVRTMQRALHYVTLT